MRADWTVSGAHISGSTAPPRVAMRRASGGAATTSTANNEVIVTAQFPGKEIPTHDFRANFTASVLRHLSAALCRKRSADHRLVWLHVSNGKDADARRLDDVDGVDADAWTDMAGRLGIVRRHVGRDDDRDDAAVVGAHAVAVSPDGWQQGRNEPELADRAGRHRILLRLDCVRNCWLPIWRDACRDRNATADSGESRSDRGRCCRRDRWRTPIQRVEGASPCLLQGAIETRAYVAGGCCHGLAARAASRPPLYLRLHWLYGDPPRHRGHGSASDGSCHGSNYCRTARTERRARRASCRDCRGRGRAALACEGSSRARITRRIVRIVRNGASGSSRHTCS